MSDPRKNPVTPEKLHAMIRLHQKGWNHAQIGHHLGFASSTVTTRLGRHYDEVTSRGKALPERETRLDIKQVAHFKPSDEPMLRELYAAGIPYAALTKAFPGQTVDSLYGAIKRLGLPGRGGRSRNSETVEEYEVKQKTAPPAMCEAIEDRISELAKRGLGPMLIATHTRQPYRVINETMERLGLLRAVGA
jgi:hypothetical protein